MGGMYNMTGKFLRNTMIGFCVFISVIIITYVTVTYLYRASAAKAAASVLPVEESAAASTAEPLTDENITACDYYLARFNGKGISVFVCSGSGEEFLYNIDIRASDISDEEMSKLKEGIVLPDKQALASFEEDFSS